jgi:hypothetical protein
MTCIMVYREYYHNHKRHIMVEDIIPIDERHVYIRKQQDYYNLMSLKCGMLHLLYGYKLGISPLRACLAQLQTAPDPKNQLHSKFFLPNTPSSSRSTTNLLQEKGGAKPQIHGFSGVALEALHKTKFGGKKRFASIFPRHIRRDSPASLPRSPGRRCARPPCRRGHARPASGKAAPVLRRPVARPRGPASPGGGEAVSACLGGEAARVCLPWRRRGRPHRLPRRRRGCACLPRWRGRC